MSPSHRRAPPLHPFMIWPLLLLTLAHPIYSKDHGAQLLDNLLTEGSVGEAECDALVQAIVNDDRTSLVDPDPILVGQWVSQECETRDGPEYVLRSLSVSDNWTFHYITYHYHDSRCTSPTHMSELSGRLKRSNVGGGFTMKRLKIASLNRTMFTKSLATSCQKFGKNQRPQHKKEYVFYEKAHLSGKCKHVIKKILPDMSELVTLTRNRQGRKIRQLLMKDKDGIRRYALPLILSGQRHEGCFVCETVSRSHFYSPPVLPAGPVLPAELDGEWVSEGCEALPSGVYLTRRQTFAARYSTWTLQTSLFSDPACTRQVASVHTSGYFSTGGDDDVSIVDGAFNLNLTETCSCIDLPAGPRTKRQTCQRDGCRSLIHTQHTIFKVTLNYQGTPRLQLGYNRKSGRKVTTFLPALLQCSILPSLSIDR